MIPENDYRKSLSKISEAISLYNDMEKQQNGLISLRMKLENRQIFKQPKNVSMFRCVLSIILLIASLVVFLVVCTKEEYKSKTQDLIYCALLLAVMLSNAVYLIIKRVTYERRCNRFSMKVSSSNLATETAEREAKLSKTRSRFDRICSELCIPLCFRNISSIESFRHDLKKKYYFHEFSSVREWSKKRFDDMLLSAKRTREHEENERTRKMADEFDAKERIGEHIIDGPSTWYDYRTGELLKQTTEGKIVNSKGEEVSSAWWE